jgi:hypothetical protein
MYDDKKITRRIFLTSSVRYVLLASTALLFGIRLKNILKQKDCPVTQSAPLPDQCGACDKRPSCTAVDNIEK